MIFSHSSQNIPGSEQKKNSTADTQLFFADQEKYETMTTTVSTFSFKYYRYTMESINNF